MSKERNHAWRATTISLGTALLLTLLGWVSLSQVVQAASDQPLDVAASITVNTTSPGINNDGACSIIEALENANADALVHADCVAGSGADVISLPDDAIVIFTTTHNTTGGGNALPVITGTVTIFGNGATLVRDSNVAPSFRFFNVAATGNLTLRDLGMRNGRAGLVGTTQLLLGGGAIVNAGTLHIIDSNLSYNRASYGGAIYSQPVTGSLTLENTTFSYNVADSHGGALYNYGPGTITDGTMRFNQALGNGGAIMQDSSMLTVTNVLVRDNSSAGVGAGIAARAALTNSHLWLETSSVISNAAALNGGGLYNTASNGLTSMVDVASSSIIANRVIATDTVAGVGGGVLNGWSEGVAGGVALMHLSQTLVTDNLAQRGGGIANLDATGYPTRTAHVDISQSTLARNIAVGVGSERGTGGGLFNSNGTATVVNSTVSGNQAVGDDTVLGGRGGGIGNVGRGITTTVEVVNSSLAFNEATQAGGGIAVVSQVTTTATSIDVGNTLIVSNVLTVTESVSNAVALAMISAPQVITDTESCSLENGLSTSMGGNIEDGAACGLTTAEDLQNTLVVLEGLALNGGATPNHMIKSTGAAFDGGVDALCTAAPVNGVDQRGISRPQGASCDVGAVELEVTPDETSRIYFPEIYKFYSFGVR